MVFIDWFPMIFELRICSSHIRQKWFLFFFLGFVFWLFRWHFFFILLLWKKSPFLIHLIWKLNENKPKNWNFAHTVGICRVSVRLLPFSWSLLLLLLLSLLHHLLCCSSKLAPYPQKEKKRNIDVFFSSIYIYIIPFWLIHTHTLNPKGPINSNQKLPFLSTNPFVFVVSLEIQMFFYCLNSLFFWDFLVI